MASRIQEFTITSVKGPVISAVVAIEATFVSAAERNLKVRSFSTIKPVLLQGLIQQKSRLWMWHRHSCDVCTWVYAGFLTTKKIPIWTRMSSLRTKKFTFSCDIIFDRIYQRFYFYLTVARNVLWHSHSVLYVLGQCYRSFTKTMKFSPSTFIQVNNITKILWRESKSSLFPISRNLKGYSRKNRLSWLNSHIILKTKFSSRFKRQQYLPSRSQKGVSTQYLGLLCHIFGL